MAPMTTNRIKRKKPDDSPDKTDEILNKAMNLCSKCNKKCTTKSESIQCDWAHASCEDIFKDHCKAMKYFQV